MNIEKLKRKIITECLKEADNFFKHNNERCRKCGSQDLIATEISIYLDNKNLWVTFKCNECSTIHSFPEWWRESK